MKFKRERDKTMNNITLHSLAISPALNADRKNASSADKPEEKHTAWISPSTFPFSKSAILASKALTVGFPQREYE